MITRRKNREEVQKEDNKRKIDGDSGPIGARNNIPFIKKVVQ